MSRRTGWSLVVAVALVLSLGSAASSSPGCGDPNPKTCGAYVLTKARWPVGSRPLVIDYRINPRNAFLPADEVPQMIAAAAHVWERANPRVHFRYRGTTDALPGLEDGINVIGWSPAADPTQLAESSVYSQDNAISEEDMALTAYDVTTWEPCPQRDGGCAGHTAVHQPGTVWYNEIQGIVTHEFGHWLSLDHPDALGGGLMTMSTVIDTRENLRYETLGLGDVLGARAAYPCGACGGAPRVFAP